MPDNEEPKLETIRLDRPAGGVVVATLDRPDRMNAMTMVMFAELEQLALDLGKQDDLRVLIVTGAGTAFCAGYDLADAAELPGLSPMGMLARQEQAVPGEPLTPTGAMGTAVLEPGYPSRAELAQRYADATGCDLANLSWYTTLALWKLAVLYEYGRRRAVAGHGDRYYQDPALVRSFLGAAHRNAGLEPLGPVSPLLSGSGRRRSPGRASR